MKGQKAYQQQEQQTAAQQLKLQQDMYADMKAGTPEEQARRKRVSQHRAAIDAKKYDQLPDLVYSMGDPDKRRALREATMTLPPTGAAALGYANADPTALASQRQYMDDALDRDNAAAFEGDVKDYIKDTDNMEAGIIDSRNGVNSHLLDNATQSNQFHTDQWGNSVAQSAQWLPSVLGGGLGMAGQIFAGAGANIGKKPAAAHS